ncbi:CHAT domain-containing protein [Haloferula sargassicola]|uniref:CHAT domain-containing protein n=1 Tax=Haloferula sargassicola TaxID=490096 RepID=A0ABP9UMV8_9BACT
MFWLVGLAGPAKIAASEDLDLSDPAAAEQDLSGLVADWRKELAEHPSKDARFALADSLQALGIVRRQLGKTPEALQNLREAVRHFAGAPAAKITDAREALALTEQDAGHLATSRKLLEKVVAERRRNGPSRALAHSLDHLAMNLLVAGHYPEVKELLEEALSLIPEDAPGDRAQLLGHLSGYHYTLGSHARSIASLHEALALDFADPQLRLNLRSQLALSTLRLGNIDKAVEEYNSISADAEKLFPHQPLRVVPYINNRGWIYLNLGLLDDAVMASQHAVMLLGESVGEDHPGLITPLNNLGVALSRQGRQQEAREVLDRCLALQEKYLEPIHLRVQETRRNLAFVCLAMNDPRALEMVDEATDVGLKLLDEVVHHGTERERLNFLSRFDPVSLPCATEDPARIAATLIASKGRLLDTLLGDSGKAIPTAAEVAAALPAGSAFADVCRYFPNEDRAAACYGAVLYLPDQKPEWVPLGSEDQALRWLGALRERLQWCGGRQSGDDGAPPTLKITSILQALDREFWQPIAELLPEGTQHVAWSPDGALHFLPLAALLDENLEPLCHRFLQVTTVGHARELLAPAPTRKLDAAPWEVITVSHFPKPPPSGEHSSRLLQLLSSLEDMPGTARESGYLRRLAPENSLFFSDQEAREEALRRPDFSPTVLHLGCHAFFLADAADTAGMPIDFDVHSDLLYAGGLVLYQGAIRPFSGPPVLPDDDILFPSEIAHLPLGKTRLVTLSSCDSGAGTPVSGEGLLGLRRSFHLAGASEVAVALWPVSDRSTPRFMRDFYLRALASDRPAQALWETQRSLIPRGDDPDFELSVLRYAPFIISQSGPLQTGPPIPLPPPIPRITILSWIAAGVLLLATGGWFFFRRKRLHRSD